MVDDEPEYLYFFIFSKICVDIAPKSIISFICEIYLSNILSILIVKLPLITVVLEFKYLVTVLLSRFKFLSMLLTERLNW